MQPLDRPALQLLQHGVVGESPLSKTDGDHLNMPCSEPQPHWKLSWTPETRPNIIQTRWILDFDRHLRQPSRLPAPVKLLAVELKEAEDHLPKIKAASSRANTITLSILYKLYVIVMIPKTIPYHKKHTSLMCFSFFFFELCFMRYHMPS